MPENQSVNPKIFSPIRFTFLDDLPMRHFMQQAVFFGRQKSQCSTSVVVPQNIEKKPDMMQPSEICIDLLMC